MSDGVREVGRYLQPSGLYTNVTDGQTDTGRQQRPRSRIASLDKQKNSAIADKPRDAFVQMQWRG